MLWAVRRCARRLARIAAGRIAAGERREQRPARGRREGSCHSQTGERPFAPPVACPCVPVAWVLDPLGRFPLDVMKRAVNAIR
eukprot:3780509-Prymnesium_polylepis.1